VAHIRSQGARRGGEPGRVRPARADRPALPRDRPHAGGRRYAGQSEGGGRPRAASGLANTSPRQAQQQGYSIAIDAGTITITFAGDQGPLAGKTLVHRPRFVQNRVEWDCAGGTLDYQYRTPECTHQ